MADFEEMRNAMNRATQGDIVTRLRNVAWFLPDATEASNSDKVIHQAADEIERLRKEINDSKS
jgi:hypothetical protein